MEKRKISKVRYQAMLEELNYQNEQGLISKEVIEEIKGCYEVIKPVGFTKAILAIASILIGIGVLSFIASNWQGMSSLLRFATIIFFNVLCNYGGIKLENKLPKTSRSLMYLGIIIYGAGIFLIGQMFHYNALYQTAFLVWAIGIIPIALTYKDKLMFCFSQVLLFTYLIYLNPGIINLLIAIIITIIIYRLSKEFKDSQLIIFLNTVMFLNILFDVLMLIEATEIFTAVIIFAIGMVMYLSKLNKEPILYLIGIFFCAGAGLMLTMPFMWSADLPQFEFMAYVFGFCYFMFLLFDLKKGKLSPIFLICILIFRYYVDLSFDFMPKSLFFIIGGLILGGFGYLFEKKRKEGGNTSE